MKILSKILLTLLLFASLNSFAKGRVCSANPKDLVKNINTAFEKRDGATMYYLLSKKSAYYFELQVKKYLKAAIDYYKINLKSKNKPKMQEAMKHLSRLYQLKNKAFYVAFFKFLVTHLHDKMPKKIGLWIVKKKALGRDFVLSLSNLSRAGSMSVRVGKERGCWKIKMDKSTINKILNH